jgi:ABC-2 type transport system permease protein
LSDRFREVYRFEVAYKFARPTTWLYAAFLLAFPQLLQQGFAESGRLMDSPINLLNASFAMALLGAFITAGLMGDSATRDDSAAMDTLFYTSPVRKREYLVGRFLGAFTVNALLLSLVPVALWISTLLPYDSPVRWSPFRLRAYLEPFLYVILPTALITGSLAFTVAALSRRTLPMYVALIAAGFGYILASEYVGSRGDTWMATLLDPFGVAPIRHSLRYWTQAERDTQLLGLAPWVLANRLFWLFAGTGLLWLLHVLFRFERTDGLVPKWTFGDRRRVTDPGAVATTPASAAVLAAARTAGSAERRTQRQLFAICRSALRDVLTSRVFMLLLAGALLVTVLFGMEVGAIVFDTNTYPVTHLMAGEVLTLPMRFVMTLIIALYAGELVWRDRDASMSSISGAAPVREWVTFAGNLIALVLVIMVIQAVLMAAGMLVQAAQGYYRFEPLLYVKILFGLTLADYALFAAMAMTLHVLVNQKALAHLAVLFVFVSTIVSGPLFRLRHKLLIYGDDPGWVYSDLNGFGPFVGPFIWFKLYWGAWALLLCLVAALFWVRVDDLGWRQRLAFARARFAGRTARAMTVAAILIVSLGGFIFYNTNILNEYRTPTEERERTAGYERLYKRYEGLAQPVIVTAQMRVEIHPERGAVDFDGSYTLMNRTATAVDTVLVRLHRALDTRSLSFDRPATLLSEDAAQDIRLYALDSPLAAGDSVRLSFRIAYAPRGFTNSGANTSVTSNGAYFDRRWLPVIGYQPAFEMENEEMRKEEGLPPRRRSAAMDDPVALASRADITDADRVQVDAIIGTAGDQVAITAGRLIREWEEGGRRYFHYRTDAPISFGSPFLSAKYAVREDKWNDVALRIYYHPTHDFNLDRLMASMKASLEYFTREFGPYPFPELRIVEFPRYASFARAHPHTIAFSEGGSLLTWVRDWDIDRPYFVVAHETAHQWWGGDVAPARVPGAGLVSETLAQYSAIMVLERTHGAAYARRFTDYEMDYYRRGRAAAPRPETPLSRVEDESYVYYRKGSVAMYALREAIGERAVNTALRRYLERFRGAPPPYPTSLDLIAEFRKVTPDSLQSLVTDLFEEVTLWSVKTDSVRAESLGDGRYRVTMRITASKTHTDTAGKAEEVPMNDLVEVGVFGTRPDTGGLGKPLYFEKHRIRSGQQAITVTVQGEPWRAGADPYRRLLHRAQNGVVEVTRDSTLVKR